MANINEPTDQIAAAYSRWARNRAFLAGEDAVKALTTEYLPKIEGQTDAEYLKYIKRVPFFAGAARIKDGLKGLIFRKPATFDIPENLQSVFDTITPTGHAFNDLAEDIVDEALTTGYVGMLIDHPSTVAGLTMDNAIANGFRPFISVYQAEAFLECTTAVVNNVQKIVRVRLIDDDTTIRELLLDNGIYTVIIHRSVDGSWIADEPIVPTKSGKPLTDIPFVLVSPKPRSFDPVKGPLDDVVLCNLHCYLEGADAKNSRYYSSAPILTIKGAEVINNLVISPGTVLQFPTHNQEKPVEIEFVEFSGAGQETLEKAYQTQKEEMAMLGLRMLASELKGVESGETHAIRRASENSILAAFARRISDRLQDAANWVSWWLDGGDVTVNLSTDFLPTPMDASEMKEWRELLAAGHISFETFCDRLIDGEKLPEDFDVEAEKQRRDEDVINTDRPSPEPTTPLEE